MQRNDIEKRRTLVAEAMLVHASERKIADELGIEKSTVHRDITAIRREWALKRLDAVVQQTSEDLERLHLAELALWPKVAKADLPSITVWLRLLERRARLLGIDAPISIRAFVTEAARKIAEEYPELDEAEIIAEAEAYLRSPSQAR